MKSPTRDSLVTFGGSLMRGGGLAAGVSIAVLAANNVAGGNVPLFWASVIGATLACATAASGLAVKLIGSPVGAERGADPDPKSALGGLIAGLVIPLLVSAGFFVLDSHINSPHGTPGPIVASPSAGR